LRRFPFVLSVPFLLAIAACGQNPPEAPSSTQPAATAPAEAATAPAGTPAAPASDAAPLFGSWGFDAPACSSPILISATSFEGAENTCEIGGFTDNGDGSFTASLDCSSQGQTANERVAMTPIFGPQGEGIRLSYLDRGGDPVTVFRCRTPQSE
jgi:hypothetical protein